MNRFVMLFKAAIATIPFFILGYLLHLTYSHAPGWLHLVANLILLAGIIFYINKTRKKYIEEGSEDYIPEYLSTSNYIYLVVGCIAGYFVSSTSNRTLLYIDNGRTKAVEVTVVHEGTFKIPANSYVSTSISKGTNELIIEGKTKTINLTEGGNWIYNIDNLNKYLETTIDYSNSVTLYKGGKIDSTKLNTPNYKIITGELIEARVNYLFEAPESIVVKKSQVGNSVTKTVLYKITK